MLIRTRLILIGLLPLLLLLLFIGGMAITQRKLDSFREKIAIADNVGKSFFNLVIVEHDLLKNRSDRPRQQWSSIMRELEPQLSNAKVIFSSTEERENVEKLYEYFAGSQRDFQELTGWFDQHQGQPLNAVQQNYLARLGERLHVNLQSAIPIASQLASINHEKAVAFDERRKNVLAIILAALAGMIFLILWPLMRGITRSVDRLKTGMSQAALGNLELRIAIAGKDELAQLAMNFNEMVSKLSEATVARETLSAEVAERKRKEIELKESKNRIEMLLNSVAEGIYGVDMQGNCTFVNLAALHLLDYQDETELLGKHMHDLIHHTRADGSHYPSAECRLYQCMGSHANVHVSDEVFWRKDGSSFSVDYWSRPTTLDGKDGAVITFFDITERKAYEEELRRSNADLEQFSYAVSHDMRQPLRMISSYLQLLERSLAGQLDGEKRDYFNFAVEGAKRIDQMLVELLEYSRIGRMGEPPTWIESRALLDEALQFLQPAIAEAQARVSIEGKWPRILASHDEILRLLQNLIGNAVKYRVAGRTPEISVTGKITGKEWQLCVADNGVGIVPGQAKRLFQVFQRLHSRDAYEGTGIGLALCRKIAEHHKGRIWVESAGEGQGSKFCVVLPVLREER